MGLTLRSVRLPRITATLTTAGFGPTRNEVSSARLRLPPYTGRSDFASASTAHWSCVSNAGSTDQRPFLRSTARRRVSLRPLTFIV